MTSFQNDGAALDPAPRQHTARPDPAAAAARPQRHTAFGFPTPASIVLFGCVLMLCNILLGAVAMRSLGTGIAQLAATHDTTVALQRLAHTLGDMARDRQDFLLTGQSSVLDRYRAAAASLSEQVARLRTVTAAVPRQRRLVQSLVDQLAREVAAEPAAIDASAPPRAGGLPTDIRRTLQATEQRFDAIRQRLGALRLQEEALNATRFTTAQSGIDRALDIAVVRTAIGVALMGLLLYVLRRDARVRADLEADRAIALAEAAAALDRQSVEQRQVERALHSRELLLQGLTDAIPQIVFVAYGDGGIEFINRRWHQYSDAPVSFSHMQDWDWLVHPADVTRLRVRWQQAIRLSAPLVAEFRLRSKHGHYLWFLARAVPVAEAQQGAVERWVGTFTDIDHLHRADAARRESEDRFRRIFEGSPFGMTLSEGSDERRILQANSAFCRMLGYQPGELIGHSLIALTHPDDQAAARTAAQEPAVDHVWHERDKRYVTKQGGAVWVHLRSGLFDAPEGAPAQFLAVVEDISRQREVDEALRQAQRMEAVGQLSGGLAHDFNNLLGVIIGNIECLLDTMADDPERAEFARDVLDSALDGAELTRRLLAFGRRQSLSPQRIDLSAQVARHVTLLGRTLGRAIQVETVYAEGLWPTHADPSQLGDALLNLAINARDAMPHGGVLTIETYNDRIAAEDVTPGTDMVAGDYVVLAVSDTGVGMPPGIRARAAEPFFTTKAPGAGSGLGLSMIYGFVRQSGGHMTIASEVGIGTTVRLCLPRVSGEQQVVTADPVALPHMPTGSETILVVDDSAEMRQVAERHLRFLGYQVVGAENGPAALALLRAGTSVDLLFTDIAMPEGVTGFQLAEAAGRICPGLKVLFTTGYVGNERDSAAPDWQQKLIRKPYRRQELAEKIRAALGG